jgi:hypothetical protein
MAARCTSREDDHECGLPGFDLVPVGRTAGPDWVIVAALTVLSAFISLHIARISDWRSEPAAPGGDVSVSIEGNIFNDRANVLGAGIQVNEMEGNRRNDPTPPGARGAGSAR